MKLRDYQEMMLRHVLQTQRCALWADMGMGKTSTMLTSLEVLDEFEEVFPALVIAPKRVANHVWIPEAHKWGVKMSMVDAARKQNYRAMAVKKLADITTINYENIPWLVHHLDGKWPYKTIIADESTRLKSFRTRQGGLRARKLGLVAHQSTRFIELTGTPIPNGLEDLWGQMWFLDAGQRLGTSFQAFQQRWFRSDYMGYNWTPLPHAFKEITELVRDLCLTVKYEDHFPVDKPVFIDIEVTMDGEGRKSYDDMEKTMYAQLAEEGVEAFNAAGVYGKCMQMANGAVYIERNHKRWINTHDQKIEALSSIIEESCGEPLVVAYQFESDKERLLTKFKHAKTLDDPNAVQRWNDGEVSMLLIHPASAGHGLNLQGGGRRLAFFGLSPNLEHYQQVIERIGPVRQKQSGFDRAVYIYRIVAKDTIDTDVLIPVLEGKADLQTALKDAMRRKL